MDNNIYIMLSRQTGLFRKMEVTANNIANANTTGYHAQQLMFSDYLVSNGDGKDAYANDPSSYRDTTGGSLKMTGNTFDLAISGAAYFQVETPLGTRYTRAGNFQLNSDGAVVTPEGYAVLGSDGGPVIIPDNAKHIVINGSGQVIADGEQLADIGIMEFKNEQAMKRLGNNLYSSDETPEISASAHVVQGAIESSNVQAVNEMVKVIETNRSVASTAKFIEAMYDLQRKTSTTYTRSQQS